MYNKRCIAAVGRTVSNPTSWQVLNLTSDHCQPPPPASIPRRRGLFLGWIIPASRSKSRVCHADQCWVPNRRPFHRKFQKNRKTKNTTALSGNIALTFRCKRERDWSLVQEKLTTSEVPVAVGTGGMGSQSVWGPTEAASWRNARTRADHQPAYVGGRRPILRCNTTLARAWMLAKFFLFPGIPQPQNLRIRKNFKNPTAATPAGTILEF